MFDVILGMDQLNIQFLDITHTPVKSCEITIIKNTVLLRSHSDLHKRRAVLQLYGYLPSKCQSFATDKMHLIVTWS